MNTLQQLAGQLEGKLYYDTTMRTLYATDASAYRELPLAVAIPKTIADIKKLIAFANQQKTSLIPRTAGTSLAGQVVGSGIIVDVSKEFTKILELNKEEHWVRVQPGVIRDELNMFLKEHGLFFGPETSTANRAMIGGMVGNNSCGSNSIVYGSTREHLISVKAILSDGSETEFKAISKEEFEQKCQGQGTVSPLERQLYQTVQQLLSDPENQEEIRREFPKKTIHRRNTGYAVDLLLETSPFTPAAEPFNFCKLIAGSEGTLAFITEIKLNVSPLPPKESGLLCIHCHTIDESLRANLVALQYKPSACELIDHYILDCTKNNIEQSKNRFFVQGEPGAILVVELSRETREEVEREADLLKAELQQKGLGYHYPLLFGEDTKKIWTLRKAGLGLLSNMPGDAKPVPVIEDTAIDVQELPAYIREFNVILEKHGLHSVHYAHAGSGELHLRPIINLKTPEGNALFRTIAEEIAILVKKYKGSLSGEHGDGRLRGEFIRYMVGAKNYKLLEEVKRAWDPNNIFNPGKIVDTPPMHTSLRFTPGQETPQFNTVFDFSATKGILRAAEQCNGSGDCRKTQASGGTMCPSYMVTRNEKDTTRARANILREFLTNSNQPNRFNHEEIKEVMDLCISCKGCKSECPSNVDMAKMKAEFLQQYYDANGINFRTRMVGNFTKATSMAAIAPGAYNFLFKNELTASIAKQVMGFAPKRSLPLLHSTTLQKWYKKHQAKNKVQGTKGKVYLFCDEFTNFNDTEIGIKAIQLLEKLGYEVIIPAHQESGRTYISKGLLREAKKIAIQNIQMLKGLITPETPLIGIEPSAILTLRDEYLDLVGEELLPEAVKIAGNALLIDEFIAREIDNGNITKEAFTQEKKLIKLHGHCHQKALSSLTHTKKMLSLPENYTMHLIPSGCCGMAGSFGYEKEHYEVSMQIGELVLFPTVRKQPAEVLIAAPGTSCRHQIKDGTGRLALHPVEILWEALKK
ncbi:FAD-linked oxidase C-terminal domain-containing protein [Rhodocytophaga aerolata]|uniref:FAD-linked oxidase C-terminal domain-containing protein n=1 Tax=Rhodocytophaga aerolata TaxID=455078 RepID=A0ABT8R235_9BACT|nr:FAD-binding and (Fe-S)-binding domain-containing protein [Rhodocytophaga aerolata]MDO1446159.1 FAD-linked oxidase C-terminal domain-containing protein [Rhodocytophaga aerolata]